jgi:hypothetical protein
MPWIVEGLDLRVATEAAVGQHVLGPHAGALLDLLDHRHHLPGVRSLVGHLRADDHLRPPVAAKPPPNSARPSSGWSACSKL